MLRWFVFGFGVSVIAAASAAAENVSQFGQAQQCIALDLPQYETKLSVTGTYAGQTVEFRVTVDGKPVNLDSKEGTKEGSAPCAYTS